MPPDRHETQPSAEIVRVESAKCRRGCDVSRSRAALCGDRACRMREMQARVRFGFVRRNPLRRSCVWRARNAGESAICPGPEQPSAEIVRVGRAKCRRECDVSRSGATLCGDRACRGREMQARVRVGYVRRNPLRRSCVSRVRNAGKSAILCPAQPSAEIVRVEGAKCRRECELVVSGATLCGDRDVNMCLLHLHDKRCAVGTHESLVMIETSFALRSQCWRQLQCEMYVLQFYLNFFSVVLAQLRLTLRCRCVDASPSTSPHLSTFTS